MVGVGFNPPSYLPFRSPPEPKKKEPQPWKGLRPFCICAPSGGRPGPRGSVFVRSEGGVGFNPRITPTQLTRASAPDAHRMPGAQSEHPNLTRPIDKPFVQASPLEETYFRKNRANSGILRAHLRENRPPNP